jgi:hypothetical protein
MKAGMAQRVLDNLMTPYEWAHVKSAGSIPRGFRVVDGDPL